MVATVAPLRMYCPAMQCKCNATQPKAKQRCENCGVGQKVVRVAGATVKKRGKGGHLTFVVARHMGIQTMSRSGPSPKMTVPVASTATCRKGQPTANVHKQRRAYCYLGFLGVDCKACSASKHGAIGIALWPVVDKLCPFRNPSWFLLLARRRPAAPSAAQLSLLPLGQAGPPSLRCRREELQLHAASARRHAKCLHARARVSNLPISACPCALRAPQSQIWPGRANVCLPACLPACHVPL